MNKGLRIALIALPVAVVVGAVGGWATARVGNAIDERDHRHIKIGAEAQHRIDSISLADELQHMQGEPTDEANPQPQLAPGTQTMLGDDGEYHSSRIIEDDE